MRNTSDSSLLESSEAVPVVDSSTASTDVDPAPSLPLTCQDRVFQPTTHNRLLMQLLAGNSPPDTDGFSGTETGSRGMSVTSELTSQSISAMMQTSASTGNELSEDLSSVNMTDLFNVPDLLAVNQTGSVGKLDVEDQLLMAQLEQAIMNSELSLEDLDHLLAVGSSTNTMLSLSASALTASGVTDRQLMSQHHSSLLGDNLYSLLYIR